MNGGVKSLLVVASIATASCSAAPGEVKIRPIADPASKMRPGDDRLADAKAQLALGNVGLALEGFRKGSREAPDSAEAFAGMAACYDAMGRYDLAQSNYEAALALAPRNAALLNALAGSLDRQGKRDAAAEVRNEVALLNAAAAALDQTQAEPDQASSSADAAPSVAVALPPARPISSATAAATAPSVAVALPPARPIASEPAAATAPSVTVALPPARAIASATAAATAPAAPTAPAMKIPDVVAEVNLGANGEPRLERLSLGEVALVTERGPIWRGQVVSRSPRSVTVRWVPLTMASARPNIRLLNAARRQGLAARTREYLLGRGWRKIEIGDSNEIRGESIVLYPAARPATGRSLAAQFGFRARAVEKGDVFVVLLGRDAARPSLIRG